jgi:uncharacterized protein (DUF924 family)
MQHVDVIQLWFSELSPAQWWRKDEELDLSIRRRFSDLHAAAAQSELWRWRETPEGRLAEILVLDQLSRNIHRGTPLAFACDPLALALAQHAVQLGADAEVPRERRNFLYMPYMHSESAVVHEEAARLFADSGEQTLQFLQAHTAIIDRFGRYPHRNAIVGRESTPEEIEFLKQPGSSF